MAQALRSTRILTAEGLRPAALLVEGEKIAAVRAWDDVTGAAEVRDFGDLIMLPGLVDSHVHIMRRPGGSSSRARDGRF